MAIDQTIASIIGILVTIFIASQASSLKRFVIGFIFAFLIATSVYFFLADLANLPIPIWMVPIFMGIAIFFEIRREAKDRGKEKLPPKQ